MEKNKRNYSQKRNELSRCAELCGISVGPIHTCLILCVAWVNAHCVLCDFCIAVRDRSHKLCALKNNLRSQSI